MQNEMPKKTIGATPCAGMDNGVDFSFVGRTPTTMSDVTNILFGGEVTKMVKEGNPHILACFINGGIG